MATPKPITDADMLAALARVIGHGSTVCLSASMAKEIAARLARPVPTLRPKKAAGKVSKGAVSLAEWLEVPQYAKQISGIYRPGGICTVASIAAGCVYADTPCKRCNEPLGTGTLEIVALAGGLMHQACERAFSAERWAQWDAERAQRMPAPSIESLKLCACGHDAENHEKDTLENLLACKFGFCDCGHFHYDLDATVEQNAQDEIEQEDIEHEESEPLTEAA